MKAINPILAACQTIVYLPMRTPEVLSWGNAPGCTQSDESSKAFKSDCKTKSNTSFPNFSPSHHSSPHSSPSHHHHHHYHSHHHLIITITITTLFTIVVSLICFVVFRTFFTFLEPKCKLFCYWALEYR